MIRLVASRTRSRLRPDSGEAGGLLGIDQLALATQVVVGDIPTVVPGSVEEWSMQIEEAIIGQVTNIEETGFVGMRPADMNEDDDEVVLCYDASSDEDEDAIICMDRPVVEEIVSDIVDEFAHKSYFLHLCIYMMATITIFP